MDGFFSSAPASVGASHPQMGHIALGEKLKRHAFTAGLTDAQIGKLANLADEVSFAEDELILVDGQRSRAFYLLLCGSVAVELRSPRYVVCVEALGAGQVFGWSALLENQDTLFQVRARERTRALRFESGPLHEVCQADPVLAAEILYRILQVVAGRVKATEIRFAEMCGIKV